MLDSAHWLAALVAGLGLEALIGDPRRWHPLAGFGRMADLLRQRLTRGSARLTSLLDEKSRPHRGVPSQGEGGGCGYKSTRLQNYQVAFQARLSRVLGMHAIDVVGSLARGLTGWIILIGGSLAFFALLDALIGFWAHALALWFALGVKSLRAHVLAIAAPLSMGDLSAARLAVSQIVSRDCRELDEEGVARAALESTLENGSDAIFATLFWFALLGGWGVVLHRLANTLDAMWGYRTTELEYFGKTAARIDDVLNYLPARLTALSYALLGTTGTALACWRDQARLWDSPNAGPVMAAGAGALNVSLGGDATYHGQLETRPVLGAGPRACAADIQRGVDLVARTFLIWVVLLAFAGVLRCWF